MTKRPAFLLTLLLACALACGCGPSTTSQKLIGKWKGRPDTFEANRNRDPIPTAPGYEAKQPAADTAKNVALTEEQQKLKRLQPSEITDLEAFDFVVTLEFQRDGTILMALDDENPIRGSWRVLSTDVGVSRLELTDSIPPKRKANQKQDASAPDPDAPTLTRRRFSVKLNKKADGFTLREEGADPRFGWLYFERVE